MVSHNVFILGATGFIGGELLYQVLHTFPNFHVSVLVRTEAKAKALTDAVTKDSHKICTVIGDLSSFEVLEEEYTKADIVITAADVDDEASAEVLAKVAKTKTTPFYVLHTSGTSVLGDGIAPDTEKNFKNIPYSDLTDNDKLNSLPDKQPHRLVDKIILGLEAANPKFVKTVIVCPPTIYGFNHGYVKRTSDQVPRLIRYSIKNDQAFTVYNGNYIWTHVHVRDLGKLYILILTKLLNNNSTLSTGSKGYYFAENGTHYWKDVAAAVARTLADRNKVSKEGVAELSPEKVTKLVGFGFGPSLWGTNSLAKADLSRKIGWKPEYEDETFWEDIIQQADYIIDGSEIPC